MKDYQERLNELSERAQALRGEILETLTPTQAGADALSRAYFRADDLVRELEAAKKGAPL